MEHNENSHSTGEATSASSALPNVTPGEVSMTFDEPDAFLQSTLMTPRQNTSSTPPEYATKVWFPYLMEFDKTANFPFSEKTNKQYTSALSDHPFHPSVTPQTDWIVFAREVWDYIEPFLIPGISVDQYALTLKNHFTEEEWTQIYSGYIYSHTDPEAKARSGRAVLSRYTRYCYSIESRVRDLTRYLKMEDAKAFSTTVRRYRQLDRTISSRVPVSDYLELLHVICPWTSEERFDFLQRKDCLNAFGAPRYENMTKDVTDAALAQITLNSLKKKSDKRPPTDESSSVLYKRPRTGENRRVTSDVQSRFCATRKYSNTFQNWKNWRQSESLRSLINDAWSHGAPLRTFQSFELPWKGRPLGVTKHEKDFRRSQGLCAKCGNHPSGEGQACKFHPIYEDIKLDNNTIMGKPLSSLTNEVRIAPLSVEPYQSTGPSVNGLEGYSLSNNDVLNSAFPLRRRSRIAAATRRTRRYYSASAELLTPRAEWRDIRVNIDTHSQRSFVTTAFVAEHNMDAFVTPTTDRFTITAHLHGTTVVSETVLWVRLLADGECTDLMAYVVDFPKRPELLCGVDWLDNYAIGLPRDTLHEVRIAVGLRKDPWNYSDDDDDEDALSDQYSDDEREADLTAVVSAISTMEEEHVGYLLTKCRHTVFDVSTYQMSDCFVNGQSYAMPVDVIEPDH